MSLAVITAAFCPFIHFLVMWLNSQQLETAGVYFWISTCPINLPFKMKSFPCPELLASELNSWARNSASPYENCMPLALCKVFLELHWEWHYLLLVLQKCRREEATEHSARCCAKTEQKGGLCSQAETSGSTWYRFRQEHRERRRQECLEWYAPDAWLL